MQKINTTILNPLFGLVFGGTFVLCLVLAVTVPFTTDESHATLRGIGSARRRGRGVRRDHGGQRADEQPPGRPPWGSPMIAAMASSRRADMFTVDGKPSDDDPREHRPRLGDERTTLAESLRCLRLTLEMKCAGLDAEAMARRSVEPSTMSLLGVVRHLAECERATFRVLMAGQNLPRLYCSDTDRDGDFDGAVPDPGVVAKAWEAWRAEVDFATAVRRRGAQPRRHRQRSLEPARQRWRADVAARGAGRDDRGVRPPHGSRRRLTWTPPTSAPS